MKYLEFDLTDSPVRPDGYYWVSFEILSPIVAQYTYCRHPRSGKWYGFWRLPGHSMEWKDSDFAFIASKPLECPPITV